MLPDFPKAKRRLHEILLSRMQNATSGSRGTFGIKSVRAFEGDGLRTIRADGQTEKLTPIEVSTKLEIGTKDILQGGMKRVMELVDQAASDMVGNQQASMLKELSTFLDSHDRTIDGKGKKFDAEMFLNVLDSVEIDFDNQGKFKNLAWIIPPEMVDRFKQVFKDIESDLELKAKLDELVERKKRDFNVREASRKLVG